MMDLEALKRLAWSNSTTCTRNGYDDTRSRVDKSNAYSEGFDDAVRELQPELTRLRKIERTVRIGIERGEAHIATCPEDHDHGYIEAAVVSLRLAIVGTPICNVDEAPPVVSPTERVAADE